MENVELGSCGSTSVRVKTLLAPINPSDINMVEGTYSLLPELPATGGNEAVFEVTEVGAGVSSLSVGDRVIPADAGLGTWCTEKIVDANYLTKVPASLTNEQAATIAVNPSTAYRMLKDFVDLQAGDCVIQNCANSAVGEAVIQIARAKGCHTINIVRSRPDLADLKVRLQDLGADVVLTEDEIGDKDKITHLPKPKLALNGTCGKIATEMTRVMGNKSTMVTYGGMSRRPIMIGATSFIFKDISFRGYWQTRWNKENGPEKRLEMMEELAKIYAQIDFKVTTQPVPFTDGLRGVETALQGFRHGKVVYTF